MTARKIRLFCTKEEGHEEIEEALDALDLNNVTNTRIDAPIYKKFICFVS